MTTNAIDCISASSALSHAEGLKAAGVLAVGLYTFDTSAIKQLLDLDIAERIHAAGFHIFNLWENGSPTDAAYFTEPRADHDAPIILKRAKDAGQSAGKPIFLTVDYDAQAADLPAITNYFETIHAVVKPGGYTLGAYGNGLVLAHLKTEGWISRAMLSCSRGFAGYADFLPHADIVQSKCDSELAGVTCDLCSFQHGEPADYGAW